jgi:hypothetical protein
VFGNVEDRLDAVVNGDGERVFRSTPIADAHEDGVSGFDDDSCPIPIVSGVAQAEATAVKIDDNGEAKVRLTVEDFLVTWREVEI